MKLDNFQQAIVDYKPEKSTLITVEAGAGCVAYNTPIKIRIKEDTPKDVLEKIFQKLGVLGNDDRKNQELS